MNIDIRIDINVTVNILFLNVLFSIMQCWLNFRFLIGETVSQKSHFSFKIAFNILYEYLYIELCS